MEGHFALLRFGRGRRGEGGCLGVPGVGVLGKVGRERAGDLAAGELHGVLQRTAAADL